MGNTLEALGTLSSPKVGCPADRGMERSATESRDRSGLTSRMSCVVPWLRDLPRLLVSQSSVRQSFRTGLPEDVPLWCAVNATTNQQARQQHKQSDGSCAGGTCH